jgi:hypothetical protein
MTLIAKLVGLGIIIWFYMSATENKQPPIKWAVIGLIGYTIVCLIVYKGIAVPLSSGKSGGADFVIHQVPALLGFAAAHLIRKKLIKDAAAAK